MTEPGTGSTSRGVPLPAKVVMWFVLAVAVLALLWFVVFPWMEGLLPAEF